MQHHAFDLPRYMAALPLFKDMAAEALARLAAGSRLCRFARGETLFRVGTPCTEFFTTVFGQIKLFALSAGGQEKVVELAGPGMNFAEAAMFVGGTHRLSAQALSDSMVLAVSKPVLLDEIAHDPALALRMLSGLSRRMHRLIDDVEAYALHSGLRRVADYLLDELQQAGPAARAVSLPVSKATIALRLSITPEYFSRVLHQLEDEGLIRIDKRAIAIASPECLRAFASIGAGTAAPSCPHGECAKWAAQRPEAEHLRSTFAAVPSKGRSLQPGKAGSAATRERNGSCIERGAPVAWSE
ncbi:MAG: Crp/Fnr family transcriptional regulator [Ideonella sp.]|nr:Crp/Fnr family transcriptional regulator [Ideonella sp.]MCC7458818.1 Crp/Fnr family transcriptional regulator [Nitrospira sp.]